MNKSGVGIGGKGPKGKQVATQILVNEDGKLLDHNGQVLNLVYPMSKDEHRKLIKEIKESLQPMAS